MKKNLYILINEDKGVFNLSEVKIMNMNLQQFSKQLSNLITIEKYYFLMLIARFNLGLISKEARDLYINDSFRNSTFLYSQYKRN